MLTRFVRIQLAIFAIVGVIGTAVMIFTYLQAPTLLHIGKMQVTLEMGETGGLYRFSNVTYRGVQIGKVSQEPVPGKDRPAATTVPFTVRSAGRSVVVPLA